MENKVETRPMRLRLLSLSCSALSSASSRSGRGSWQACQVCERDCLAFSGCLGGSGRRRRASSRRNGPHVTCPGGIIGGRLSIRQPGSGRRRRRLPRSRSGGWIGALAARRGVEPAAGRIR